MRARGTTRARRAPARAASRSSVAPPTIATRRASATRRRVSAPIPRSPTAPHATTGMRARGTTRARRAPARAASRSSAAPPISATRRASATRRRVLAPLLPRTMAARATMGTPARRPIRARPAPALVARRWFAAPPTSATTRACATRPRGCAPTQRSPTVAAAMTGMPARVVIRARRASARVTTRSTATRIIVTGACAIRRPGVARIRATPATAKPSASR